MRQLVAFSFQPGLPGGLALHVLVLHLFLVLKITLFFLKKKSNHGFVATLACVKMRCGNPVACKTNTHSISHRVFLPPFPFFLFHISLEQKYEKEKILKLKKIQIPKKYRKK